MSFRGAACPMRLTKCIVIIMGVAILGKWEHTATVGIKICGHVSARMCRTRSHQEHAEWLLLTFLLASTYSHFGPRLDQPWPWQPTSQCLPSRIHLPPWHLPCLENPSSGVFDESSWAFVSVGSEIYVPWRTPCCANGLNCSHTGCFNDSPHSFSKR